MSSTGCHVLLLIKRRSSKTLPQSLSVAVSCHFPLIDAVPSFSDDVGIIESIVNLELVAFSSIPLQLLETMAPLRTNNRAGPVLPRGPARLHCRPPRLTSPEFSGPPRVHPCLRATIMRPDRQPFNNSSSNRSLRPPDPVPLPRIQRRWWRTSPPHPHRGMWRLWFSRRRAPVGPRWSQRRRWRPRSPRNQSFGPQL